MTFREEGDPIRLTREQAQQVAEWRMAEDMTWRAVAHKAHEAFGTDVLADDFKSDWAGNQLAGMLLCEQASVLLGYAVD